MTDKTVIQQTTILCCYAQIIFFFLIDILGTPNKSILRSKERHILKCTDNARISYKARDAYVTHTHINFMQYI